MVMVPPPGIASLALANRFSIANSNSPTSISTGHSPVPKSISTRISPGSERSSISRMPLRWDARSIDSGLMAWRRVNASNWCVNPVPRATARRMAARTRSRCSGVHVALQQLQPVCKHCQQIVEVVRHAAGQPPDGFQLLRLAKRLLGFSQALLVAHAFGDVVHELVRADAHAVAIAQSVVAHLVEPAIPRRITEFPDLHELLAAQRAAPYGLDRRLMLGLRSQQLHHAVADLGADAEDAFELVRRRPVDGKPPVLEISHLDEGVGAFHDVGQELALRERLVHPALERLVQLAQGALGKHPSGRLRARTEHSGDLAALVAQRRIGEGEPRLFVVALAIHHEWQVLAIDRLACHGRIDQRADVRPDLRPDVVKAPAQGARMLGAKDLGVRVVVEEAECVSPRDEHRETRLKKEPDDRSQRLRPGFRSAQRRFRPVVGTHQCTHRAASVQELDGPVDRWQSWLEHHHPLVQTGKSNWGGALSWRGSR